MCCKTVGCAGHTGTDKDGFCTQEIYGLVDNCCPPT